MKKQASTARGVTVHDVARHAEVSIATVSRVLNNPDGGVNTAMAERVLAAVAELGYTTNSAGKALRIARTRTIATLLPRLDDPIFSEIAHGIQETLFARGYAGFVQTSGYDNGAIFDAAHRLFNRGAEGLLVFGRVDDARLLAFINKQPIPVLQVYSYLDGHVLPSIGIDNALATRKIAELMLQIGHRRIAMISGPTVGNDRQQDRLKAYAEIMTREGLAATTRLVEPGYSLQDAGQAFRRILAEAPGTTAVMCNTDLIACGVLAECRKLGLRVPEDLSVSGFEDVSFAPLLSPPLTTLSVPTVDIGRHAARAMIAALEEGQALTSVEFDANLVLRGSVAAPRGDALLSV